MSLLASGQYPDGTRLPPERKLGGMLGLSRSALREGLLELEAQGGIWRGVGRGTFVGARPPEPAVRLSIITARTSPTEVLEVRLMFEPLIARLAAIRATESDLTELKRLLEKGASAPDLKTWELLDSRLHRRVAEAAHNHLLLHIFDAFNAVRKQISWGRLRKRALTVERRQHYSRHHSAFVTAILSRDPDRAEAMMRRHVEAVRNGYVFAGASELSTRGMGNGEHDDVRQKRNR